jgi:uncharacterized protein (DUF486 family)
MPLTQTERGAIGVVLLLCSNCFMNTAWYLHLKVRYSHIDKFVASPPTSR